MNKAVRLFATAGMGVIAGLAIGAGPAQAADAADQRAVQETVSTSSQVQQHRDRDRVVRYYRSYPACALASRIAERWDRWHDYDCEFVRFGFRRGMWALEAERDRPGHGHGRPWSNNHGHR